MDSKYPDASSNQHQMEHNKPNLQKSKELENSPISIEIKDNSVVNTHKHTLLMYSTYSDIKCPSFFNESEYVAPIQINHSLADANIPSNQSICVLGDGIYGPQSNIPKKTLSRLKNRLLSEDPDRNIFFTCNNKDQLNLSLQASPLELGAWRIFHPPANSIEKKHFLTRVVPPGMNISNTGDEWFQLTIHVNHAQFFDHPLFTKEELLCSQIQICYSKYIKKKEENLVTFLKNKITILCEIVKEKRKKN